MKEYRNQRQMAPSSKKATPNNFMPATEIKKSKQELNRPKCFPTNQPKEHLKAFRSMTALSKQYAFHDGPAPNDF